MNLKFLMLIFLMLSLLGCNSEKHRANGEAKEEYTEKEKYLKKEHSSRLKKDEILRDRLVKLSIELHKKGLSASEVKAKLDEEAATIEKEFASAPK